MNYKNISLLVLAGATLFAANITAKSVLANAVSNPTEAFAKSLKIVMENTTNEAIGSSVEEKVYASIKDNYKDNFFSNPDRGVLVRVSVYKTPNGFSHLPIDGVAFVGHDKDPATAYCNYYSEDRLEAAPPRGLVYSKESSYFMWLTPVGNRIRSQKMEFPFYQEFVEEARQKYRSKSCDE